MVRATMRWALCAPQVGSSRAVLCNHPIAEVLSPIARMHAWLEPGSRHANQILITIPRNSRRLLTRLFP